MAITANHKAHTVQIPLETLPKTFKDAITVAHELKYKYLWIDALCIIQDDTSDLVNELSIMADIYRRAELTICAVGAESSDSGFFHDRDYRRYRPCDVVVSTMTDNKESKAVVTLTPRCYSNNFLESRGWVLQEEVMPSRRRIFGSQMAWSCALGRSDETQPGPPNRTSWSADDWLHGELAKTRHYLFGESQSSLTSRPTSRLGYFEAWRTVVEDFTARNLSYVSDTLPALSGTAASIARAHGTTYLAGLWLWDEDLCRGLTWFVADKDLREAPMIRNEDKRAKPNAREVKAAKIRYFDHRTNYRADRCRYVPQIEILQADCKAMDLRNPYGKAKGVRLKIRGYMEQVSLQSSASYTTARREITCDVDDWRLAALMQEQLRFPAIWVDPQTKEIMREAALDLKMHPCLSVNQYDPDTSGPGLGSSNPPDLEPEFQVQAWCLLIQKCVPTRRLPLPKWMSRMRPDVFLLLQPAKQDAGVYERVGVGFTDGLDWFHDIGQEGQLISLWTTDLEII